jgi:hypothetical protein
MQISKNQLRKVKKYASNRRYFDYLLMLFKQATAIETELKEQVDLKGNLINERKKVWTSFYNQLDYSLLRKDRNLTTDFINYLANNEDASGKEYARMIAIEIENYITKINKYSY